MEYLASGLPVITSRYNTLEKILGYGKRGILVKPGQPEEYAGAIHRLYTDKKLREGLSHNAREYIINEQSWKQHCESILELFKNILRSDENK
jgi:glycosyltransferase involved in cell wall biosynthesis